MSFLSPESRPVMSFGCEFLHRWSEHSIGFLNAVADAAEGAASLQLLFFLLLFLLLTAAASKDPVRVRLMAAIIH